MTFNLKNLNEEQIEQLICFVDCLLLNKPLHPEDLAICIRSSYEKIQQARSRVGAVTFDEDAATLGEVLALALGMWNLIEGDNRFSKFSREQVHKLYFGMRGEDAPPLQLRTKPRVLGPRFGGGLRGRELN